MQEDPDPSGPSFEPINVEEIIVEHWSEALCNEIKKLLNSGDEVLFVVEDEGLMVRTAEAGAKSFILRKLEKRVLHISHYSHLSSNPG